MKSKQSFVLLTGAVALLSLLFIAARPDPAGTGYVVAIDGVMQVLTLRGDAGQTAGYCDGGIPCATTPTSAFDASALAPVPQTGACASMPTATGSGRTFHCDDATEECVDDPVAVAWKCYATTSGFLGAPVTASAYTTYVQSSPQNYLFLNGQGPNLQATISDNANVGCALRPATFPSTPWAVTQLHRFNTYFSNYPGVGVCVANGTTIGTSSVYCMGASFAGATSLCTHQENYVLATSRSANNNESCNSAAAYTAGNYWFRIVSDSVDAHFQMSSDGYYFRDWPAATTLPTSLSQYGFCMLSSGGGAYGTATIYENQITTPITANVTGATGTSTVTISTSANTFRNGDMVAIQGVGGFTGVNNAGPIMIRSVTSTSFTPIGLTGGGSYTSGGVVTVLNR